MKPYNYGPLDSRSNSVRVLALLPSWRRLSRLQCELVHADLDNLEAAPFHFYEALSYTWGDVTGKEEIVLDKKSFWITRSLASALRQLRAYKPKHNSITFIWVDAICINQNDLKERETQVRKMTDIYSRAAQVLVWLRPAVDDSGLAMDIIDYMTNIDTPDDWLAQSLQDPAQTRTWQAVAQLFARTYWRRVWIRQEITSGKKIMVLCGDHKENWRIFVMACEFLYQERILFEQHASRVDGVYSSGFHQAIFIDSLRERLIEQGQLDLCELLFHNKACEATDARDRIFSVLGIVGQRAQDIVPDYSLSKRSVYLQATCEQIKGSKSLNILSACQDYDESRSELPSWVPDFESDWKVNMIRTKEGSEDLYQASGATAATFSFIEELGAVYLRVRGLIWDTIKEVGLQCHPNSDDNFTNTISSWTELAQKTLPSLKEQELQEALWRTVIANQDIFGDRAARTVKVKSGTLSLQQRSYPLEQTIPDLTRGDWVNADHSLFTERFHEFAIDRSMFGTQRGQIGMGHKVQAGDLVCILFGADVPFIVRRCSGGFVVCGEACKWYVRLTGSAWSNLVVDVHGIMDGEVVKEFESGQIQAEELM